MAQTDPPAMTETLTASVSKKTPAGIAHFQTYKRVAVRYWEIRRLIYNTLLVPPAFVGYIFGSFQCWMGDEPITDTTFSLVILAFYIFAANVCYSLCYALEFTCGSDDPQSRWLQLDRTIVFMAGMFFAMLLALGGGANIAFLEFQYATRNY